MTILRKERRQRFASRITLHPRGSTVFSIPAISASMSSPAASTSGRPIPYSDESTCSKVGLSTVSSSILLIVKGELMELSSTVTGTMTSGDSMGGSDGFRRHSKKPKHR